MLERIITLDAKGGSNYPANRHRVIIQTETATGWIGFPESWRERGLPLERPLLYPKFAWEEITQ